MLEALRHLVQEVSAAQDLDQALDIIVRRVKAALQVDVCSVYLAAPENQHLILMATDGLNRETVGKVRLGYDEGLVGLVAQKQEPVNLEDAASHPRFRHVPETGEDRCHGYLGVPIIHYRRVLGVLVVQHGERRAFDRAALNFAVTAAAQLAGAIDHALAVGARSRVFDSPNHRQEPFFQGVRGAPGVGLGTVVLVKPLANLKSVPDRPVEDMDKEQDLFLSAVTKVREEMTASGDQLAALLPAEERALFDVYAMLLGDGDSLVQDTLKRIREGNWAPGAWRHTILEHTRVFEGAEDSYLRARAEDIRDLGQRVLLRLSSSEVEETLVPPDRCVLVGDELSVAQIARVPMDQLAGIVCMRGSALSHLAILARALNVPAVMGLYDRPTGHLEGQPVVVDGHTGRVYFSPSQAVLKEFRRLKARDLALSRELGRLRDLPAETPDGHRVPLYIKAGLVADAGPARTCGAEGVGLYRTEFMFMTRQSFPGEDEQYRIYREALEAFAPKPVTMRTLDVGGDKALPYFPIQENNPFLGWRGIRLTLDHPEIFRTQLRAMLRADIGLGNLRLLLPMITTVTEVDDALVLVDKVCDELREQGHDCRRPPVGVMIEVPSAVYQAAALARRVDFLSIGTNDLTQYLLAVDRENGRVSNLYDSLNPAVLMALDHTVKAGHGLNRPVGVCGEMAGDPAAAVLLLGMGMDSLSTTAANLPKTKWVIRTIAMSRARELLAQALAMEDGHTVRQMLEQELEQLGLGSILPGARDKTA